MIPLLCDMENSFQPNISNRRAKSCNALYLDDFVDVNGVMLMIKIYKKR